MTSATDFLIAQPGLTIFLTIAFGHAFGTLRLGDFSFGPIAGSPFAGVVIGHCSVVPVSGTAKSFLFGVGYSARPEFLQALIRAGVALPVAPGKRIERGDVLKFIGPEALLACTIARAGREVTQSRATDVVVTRLMTFLGGPVGGLIHETLAGIEIRLGTSIGFLLAGLASGYLPAAFRVRGGSRRCGLADDHAGGPAFIGMVCLQEAPDLGPALKSAGLLPPLLAFVVDIVPLAMGALFGHFVLKRKPVVRFGGLVESQTEVPAKAAVQSRTQSALAVLGYAPTCPVSQMPMTLWGSLMVGLLG